MKLSKRQTQLAHAAIIGFATGVLAAVQIAIATGGLTEKKGLIAAAIGVFWGGISRMAGALLNVVQTTDTPALPPDVVIQADRAPQPRAPGS